MIDIEEKTEKAIRYLHGELDAAERDALEERLFADEDFVFFLDAVEHDLIDEYVRGELTAAAKRRFEENYLVTDDRRARVRAAALLDKELFAEQNLAAARAPEPASRRRFFADFFRAPNLALAGGFAAVLLLLTAAWFFVGRAPREIVTGNNENRTIAPPAPAPTAAASPGKVSPRPDERNANDNKQTPLGPRGAPTVKPSPRESSPNERETPPPPKLPARVFAYTLLPVTRSGARPLLTVPKTAETIRLNVVHDNRQPFARYRAEIRDQNGDLIWSRELPVDEKTLSRPIVLNVRSAALASGAYELTLSGETIDRRLEEIKFYNFTVTKK